MKRFEGKAHLPGAEREWSIEMEIDWGEKDITVRILEVPGGLKEWPGLAVQTFGQMEEIVFRTKGIPPLFTHWWHFARGGHDELVGVVLSPPAAGGVWHTCPIVMNKIME